MQSVLKSHIEKKDFSHGYLLCGDFDAAREAAFEAATAILFVGSQSESVNLAAHPDFYYGKFDSFGIADSHAIRGWSATKSFAGRGKVSILEVFSFTTEAANALLKTIEEPGEDIYYFIITQTQNAVIPTLRSRLVAINVNSMEARVAGQEDIGDKEAEKFFGSDHAKRLGMIKKILEDKNAGKEIAVNFINNLEKWLEGGLKSERYKDFYHAAKELGRVREYVFLRGSSAKMILEHLALTLPRFRLDN
ncbi:TPA: hypothetical protein DEW47_03315 [Patescibacteria group bacterium]|nr:MAG: hypothetical protein UT71_C0021G0014 [Parcubacteria group bacterium GW2011_GWF2_40_10]KKR46995.1 MAG: hypothetical protein UT83_C0015G0014 [Parcubacteria group bacterium GW2011_GWA2_40_143]KKR59192.1 MAG: hypothetical protein UT97_C0016G0014 [Parcubacteria group bacterium GW2011_GWC2_40_31]KKR74867.1 MAG: hypothetical protein UU18_C0017G0004 [Parcubacteria group bacterium GW2011_GWB2_40_8]KKR82321.1 MAG: hypothetical protein UU28_C0012G0005 [Parcubacteria group bacterium GW2011_GWD2_40_